MEPASGRREGSPSGIFGSRLAWAGLAAGITLFVGLIIWQGAGQVKDAFGRAGWWIVAVGIFHVQSLLVDAIGWWCLLPPDRRPPLRTMIWGRWIGESINDLLPVLQMGGNVVKAWLLVHRGVEVGLAGASVVVDVTLLVLAQVVFTLLGLCIALPILGPGATLVVVLVGAVILGLLLAGFYAAQRKGFIGFIVRVTRRILGGPEWSAAVQGAAAIDRAVLGLYRRRRALVLSGFWHVISWVLGVGEIWFGLRLLGHPMDLVTCVLFESLGQAIRTGSFVVPGAIGIQEGGYVLVGSMMGIDPTVAIALSLARRVRELLLGIPGLIAWQASTLSRALRMDGGGAAAGSPARAAGAPPSPAADGPPPAGPRP